MGSLAVRVALLTAAVVTLPAQAVAQAPTAVQDVPQSGPAENGSPAWFIFTPPRPRPPASLPAECSGDIATYARGKSDLGDQRDALIYHSAMLTPTCKTALTKPNIQIYNKANVPLCVHSPICTASNGFGMTALNNPYGVEGIGGYIRTEWKSDPVNMGYTPAYPYAIPPGGGGAVSVGMDSKDNLWVLQRNPPGRPQLFKYDPSHKLVIAVSPDVLPHLDKAHGMAVDHDDNVWIADQDGAIVRKISPQGKILMTIGTQGRRGDWVEPKGQRLLWQPLAIAFGKGGDLYIGEGHANESPNDTGGDDPLSISGAARVVHLDRNGKFINQWYGDDTGPGKFYQAHDIAVDPTNGDVYIGDREQYRLVVYTANGHFLRTLQTRNLTCNVAFDKQGNLWIGTGGDGQIARIDKTGKVLGAMGGPGRGPGQHSETGYLTWDSHGNIYTGDTSNDRVTQWIKPAA